jgi:hypothetical protein
MSHRGLCGTCHSGRHLIAQGECLLRVCAEPGMPSTQTVYKWQNADAEFGRKLEQAIRQGRAAAQQAHAPLDRAGRRRANNRPRLLPNGERSLQRKNRRTAGHQEAYRDCSWPRDFCRRARCLRPRRTSEQATPCSRPMPVSNLLLGIHERRDVRCCWVQPGAP